MAEQVSIEECRQILGVSANGMTDAEIQAMRNELERTAEAVFTQMTKEELDTVRWDAHFQRTGEFE